MYSTDMAYRRTAAEGASGLGLLISLYDALASDLRLAASAQRANDIAKRTEKAKHALVLVGFLENWINPESGDLAQKLHGFYSKVRKGVITAQLKQSADILESLMTETLSIREAWHKLEMNGSTVQEEVTTSREVPQFFGAFSTQMETRQYNWSA